MSEVLAAFERGIEAIGATHPDMPRQTVLRVRLLHHALRTLANDLEAFFAARGVSASGWAMLMMLHSASGAQVNPSLLSASLVQSRTHMTRVADELVEKGWVSREANPLDRRRIDLAVTREGRRFIEKTLPAAWRHYEALLAPLSRAEGEQLERIMRKLLAHLESEAPERATANGRRRAPGGSLRQRTRRS